MPLTFFFCAFDSSILVMSGSNSEIMKISCFRSFSSEMLACLLQLASQSVHSHFVSMSTSLKARKVNNNRHKMSS